MRRTLRTPHPCYVLTVGLSLLFGSAIAQSTTQPVQRVTAPVLAPSLSIPRLPTTQLRQLSAQEIKNLSGPELTKYLLDYKIQMVKIPLNQLIKNPAALQETKITKEGSPTTTTQNTPEGQLLCSTQRYNIRSAPPEYAMKTLDQDKLWVGSFVRTQGLELGSMQTVNVPENRRIPYRITSALPTSAGSSTITPNQTAYNLAVAAVRQGVVGSPYGSTIRYEITEQSSAETTALKIGLKTSGIGYSVSAAGNLDNQNRQNRISAVFVQNSFTMNADLGGRTAQTGFLLNPTPEDLTALQTAAYIDSITYGRLLFVEMTSSYTSSQMKAALAASYGGSSVSVSAEASTVLSNSKFNVYAAGGNEQAVVNLIRTQRLADYFQATSDPRALVPISFTARNFNSGSYAASSSTGEYAETVCNPNSLKVGVRISYRSIEPEDSKYDDLFGELSLDGSEVWRKAASERTDLYKGQTINLYNSTQPITMNYGEPRGINLTARLMDYDSVSPNDVIGIWNETIDLRVVADQFKSSGTNIIRREFRKRGAADADGVMIVEFIRN